MKHWMGMPVAAALLLSACVTINVYFPAAEAKEAAKEFVEKVINEADKVEVKQPPAGGGGMAMLERRIESDLSGFDPWVLVGIGSARAQSAPDISIKTPAIQAIQSRMESRFNGSLRAGFDSGALGFTDDGLITVRDASKVELKDRVALNSAVADDNRDRKAVYREVAVANGHPEWEEQIRGVFAKQWIASARSGWWYQSGGSWKQK
ncbi:YdbL family protein [Thermomonas brevis]|uniref:YdbL family protein n=1 Tax=Thermomonas brevis TaxID=215691 RepID=A0A7G9QUS3_9GAMM|nr:YdbL family protein [Thermomonas brevis]QNN47098.1 YdbL family protein [Thermomonas brevis]